MLGLSKKNKEDGFVDEYRNWKIFCTESVRDWKKQDLIIIIEWVHYIIDRSTSSWGCYQSN